MRTNKFLAVGLLATMILSSCSNNEEPVNGAGVNEIKLSAGIGQTTRAVINQGYEQDLPVAFARIEANASSWAGEGIKAVRVGGSGKTAVAFETSQVYNETTSTTLLGYYPRATVATSSDQDKVTVPYTINGDMDIMATEVLTGSKTAPIQNCTFQHLLGQLQFQCVGSAAAIAAWKNISIKVKGVPSTLEVLLNKSTGASLKVNSTPTVDLNVYNCPTIPTNPDAQDPVIGYTMLCPVADLGSVSAPITLEVNGSHSNTSLSKQITISNIQGGVKAGVSHLITLIFTVDGEISASATAEIAPWNPGNASSGVVTPN
ncbi:MULTISPECIES: fimbrillin family protein [Parabacteroides]|uniref:fimbrillin family protein n=1 Tax=Parabacteroides leei TaxID=2939491 RepID=UPI0018972148|nr:fimbrillin family protein [Parabacteroides goldsteinii]